MKTIGFIGLGLIGGSIARGIKRANPDTTIMAYMRTRSRLEQAKADGIIDVILDGIGEELRQCDLIFLCTPVEYNAQYLSSIRPYLKPGALLTDVGSTKTDIHEAVTRLGMEQVFVGGHPMAGSEKTGYENSTDHLLENAYYNCRLIRPGCRAACGRCQYHWLDPHCLRLSLSRPGDRCHQPPAPYRGVQSGQSGKRFRWKRWDDETAGCRRF